MKGFLGALVVAASLLPQVAHAADPTPSPLLGTGAPCGRGWFSYSVHLRGTSSGQRNGTAELTDGSGETTRAPFAVGPRDEIALDLPFHDLFGKSVDVVVRDPSGETTSKTSLPTCRSTVPWLFELAPDERLDVALRNEHIAVTAAAKGYGPTGPLDLVVSHATADVRSGEATLPDRGLSYGGVTVALVKSDVLTGLREEAYAALTDWVAGGGTLAVVVTRPEDLAHARLVSLLSGKAVAGPSAAATFTDFVDVETPEAAAAGPASPVVTTKRVAPSADVAARLAGWSGAHLRQTRYGAAANDGLGEVHLLAFDPAGTAFVDDPWVQRSAVDLVRDAWEREQRIALAFGSSGFDEVRLEPARRLLDPNEQSRWAIALAAAILVAYAVVAIPLTFRRAARRNAPLRAIVELPLWSLGTMVLIVGIGAAAKGGRARARRLSLIECADGATRGAVTHLRALFSSSAAEIRVTATNPTSLLDVGTARGVTRTLSLSRGTAELQGLRGRPWETVLVREDGFTDLGGSVAFHVSGTEVTIENGLAHDLVAVVAHAPGGTLRYFSRITRGASVDTTLGKPIGSPPFGGVPPPGLSPALTPATPLVDHRLDVYRFAPLADADRPGSSEAWSALESTAAESTDYWPDDVATLIGEVEGGDGATTDSGLAVDLNRLFIRVVGKRGEP